MHTVVCGMTGNLLYKAENSTQYSMIIYAGKESEKEWICVYTSRVTLLCSRNYHNIVNQLYFNKTLKIKKKIWYICVYTDIHIYTHNGILFSNKNDKFLPFATTWVDLCEISQIDTISFIGEKNNKK